jgi:hypothetical protein
MQFKAKMGLYWHDFRFSAFGATQIALREAPTLPLCEAWSKFKLLDIMILSAMTTIIYDKTDKGFEEIQTRKHHLASRLRSLLVLVDGKTSDEGLLKKVAGLGLTAESLGELLQHGFITARSGQDNVQNEAQPALTQQSAVMQTASEPVPAAAPAPTAVLAEGETQYQALYNFYTSTVKANLGLRGYAMQLKVERCGSIDDFKALRQPYLEAITKSKGQEVANSLVHQLDQLLALP